MDNYITLSADRRISSANRIFYKHPTLHPDRVMNEHDLVYIVDGQWEIYQNSTSYLLEKNDVIILHGKEHHYGVNPCQAGTKTIYIHMTMDYLDHFNINNKPLAYGINTVIHCQSQPQIKILFENIVDINLSNTNYKEQKLSAYCQLLLCELTDISTKVPLSFDNGLSTVIKYIHENPHRIIPSTELAKLSFYSERTLRNKFIKIYNKTPYQYQMQLKLQNIAGVLADFPEMSIREIALNFGFCDEYHLSKTFKQHYGISPTKYRNDSLSGIIQT